MQSAQLRATLCLARAAGPASVLSAVRRRLAGTARADVFCNKVSTLNCGETYFNTTNNSFLRKADAKLHTWTFRFILVTRTAEQTFGEYQTQFHVEVNYTYKLYGSQI